MSSQAQWASPMHTQGETREDGEIPCSPSLPLWKEPSQAWRPEEQHLGGGPKRGPNDRTLGSGGNSWAGGPAQLSTSSHLP